MLSSNPFNSISGCKIEISSSIFNGEISSLNSLISICDCGIDICSDLIEATLLTDSKISLRRDDSISFILCSISFCFSNTSLFPCRIVVRSSSLNPGCVSLKENSAFSSLFVLASISVKSFCMLVSLCIILSLEINNAFVFCLFRLI